MVDENTDRNVNNMIAKPLSFTSYGKTLIAFDFQQKCDFEKSDIVYCNSHEIFDYLHSNIGGPWSIKHSGLIRRHCRFRGPNGRNFVIAFDNDADAVQFHLANLESTGGVDQQWKHDIEYGDFRRLEHTDLEVTRCALVKKSGIILDISRDEVLKIDILNGREQFTATPRQLAYLVWGTYSSISVPIS